MYVTYRLGELWPGLWDGKDVLFLLMSFEKNFRDMEQEYPHSGRSLNSVILQQTLYFETCESSYIMDVVDKMSQNFCGNDNEQIFVEIFLSCLSLLDKIVD